MGFFRQLAHRVSTKIILPYLILTLAVASVGAFVVTRLVAGSLQERFHNQLLDAGRVVSEKMVDLERERLAVLRAVSNTRGVGQALLERDAETLAGVVPQIIVNADVDAVSLVDEQGVEVFGWLQQAGGVEGTERTGADFNDIEPVRLVLDGVVDERGDKRVALLQTPTGLMLYTIGPVYHDGQQVGAALVGDRLHDVVLSLTETALARVTLYDRNGRVLATTLGDSPAALQVRLPDPAGQYATVVERLQTSPQHAQLVTANAGDQSLLRQVELLGQDYLLAYGDWRVRDDSLGLFSVALSSNFIVTASATSRNLLSLLFSIATVGVFILGLVIARRLIDPLNRLIQVSSAVARGDLNQRTGIRRQDEIGDLAHSFDAMTARLERRNRQLLEQSSKLEAILNSIADGVVVFDNRQHVIAANAAADRFLQDTGHFNSNSPNFLPDDDPVDGSAFLAELHTNSNGAGPRRYRAGGRIFSASVAPVETPTGGQTGSVVVLRDVTQEAEAEQLKDNFITGISHELRTPLTSIKGYVDLLVTTGADQLSEQQLNFLKTVQDNTAKLFDHVGKLIDMAEIHSGALALRPQRLWFSWLAENAAEQWQEKMAARDLAFDIIVHDEQLWIDGDPDRVNWAIDNLLENAHDYTLRGGRVQVTIYERDGSACLEIADTGVGISASDRPHIFDRFYRVQTEDTFNVYGLGLGLFITRSIVEAHGGRIWVDSAPGEGSTFGITLPLLEGEAPGAETVQ